MRTVTGRIAVVATLAFVMAALAPAPSSAAVGVSVDFLWSPDRDNDTQVFLHVSNMAYQPPREQVREVYPMLRNPEWEYPVVLFIASEARVSLRAVWNLRVRGLTWTQVMLRLNVPPERIFVEMPRDPGPPYGKAYGHWKKRSREKVIVTDDDVYYWANIHAMSKYFGVPPGTIVDWRESGKTWKAVAGSEYRVKKNKEGRRIEKAGVGGEKAKDRDDDLRQPPRHSKSKGKGGGR